MVMKLFRWQCIFASVEAKENTFCQSVMLVEAISVSRVADKVSKRNRITPFDDAWREAAVQTSLKELS